MFFGENPRELFIRLDLEINQSSFRQSIALQVLLPSFASSLSLSDILSEKMEVLGFGRESDGDVEGGLVDQLMEKLARCGREKERGAYLIRSWLQGARRFRDYG